MTVPCSAEASRSLQEAGYWRLPDPTPPELLERLKRRTEALLVAEGDRAGAEFKQESGCRRLANLVDKDPLYQQVIAHPEVLGCVAAVLGPRFKLSSLNARSVDAGAVAPQPLHADMAALPDASGFWVCNVIWMLDAFTPENGPTRIVPGSHRWGRLPQEDLDDPCGPHPREMQLTGPPGTVVVMNAHAWHGGLGNHSNHPRLALHAFYCRWDKPQQQYQKALLRPETVATLSPDLRELLALDDTENDRLSRDVRVRSGFLK